MYLLHALWKYNFKIHIKLYQIEQKVEVWCSDGFTNELTYSCLLKTKTMHYLMLFIIAKCTEKKIEKIKWKNIIRLLLL